MGENPKVFEQILNRLKRRRMFKRAFRFFKWLFLSVLFLLLSIWILLQFPSVQNYLVHKVTDFLSTELDTKVTLERIDIEFFNKLVLEEFYLEDQKGDTLLYSKELKATFKTNFLALFSKELVVDNIYLNSARFNLLRDSSENYNNIQFLADYFINSKPKDPNKKKAKPFLLHVNGVFLNDVYFYQDDKVSGQLFSVYLEKGEILMEDLNIPDRQVAVKSVILSKPIVTVQKKTKYPYIKPPDRESDNKKPSDSQSVPAPVDSSKIKQPFALSIGHFSMLDGVFNYDQLRQSPVRTKPEDILDFKHLNVFNINIDIDSFHYTEGVFKGMVNQINLEEKSGFVLNQLSAKEATVSSEIMSLNGMKLITPQSNLGDTLVMEYSSFADFSDFENEVRMTGNFNNSEVAIGDIIVFAPVLGRNKYFKNNEKEVVKINGDITGTVNKLRGKDLTLQIAGNTIIQGDFSTRDLSVKGEEFLSLKLDRFRSNMRTMRLLIPGFDVPENFNKLGTLNFSGRFDGFFNDFVAFGMLSTALGRAEMDMHLNLRQGREQAEYEGKLSLFDFDLKKWSGNENLGNISFVSEVKEGVGLTLETVNATLAGKIQEFTFKEYTYNNITLDGELTKNKFDGKLVSLDQNIDFVFNGKIELIDSIPEFNFDASINHFDLQALNLSKNPMVLEGDVVFDFVNFNLSEIAGEGAFYDFKIINATDTFSIDTIVAYSEIDLFQRRSFVIDSDVVELNMEGYFDIQEVPGLFGQYLVKNFPVFSERFKINANTKELKDSQFDFELRIPNSKNLLQLINPALDTIRYAYVKGRMNNMIDSIKIVAEFPELRFGNIQFDDILFRYEGLQDESAILLDIYHTSINDKQHFEPLKLEGFLDRDTFYYDITSTNFTSVFDDLNLKGKFFLVDDFFQVQFLPSNLVILKDQWDIVKDNYIRFGKGYVETKNFDLRNIEKRIVVESIEGTGLTMSLENFDLSIINEWWVYDRLDFSGKFFVLLEVGNIYDMENIFATAICDSIRINQDYFGELQLDVAMESMNDQMDAYIDIKNDLQELSGHGFVAPISKINKSGTSEDFNFNFSLKNYPLDILEYFIPNGISNTVGMLDSDLRLYGKLKAPKIDGEAYIRNMGVTIDYLQTRYTAPAGKLKINNEFLFDASENVIYDALGNTALITGGIRHTDLKKLRLDVSMSSDNFLFLNTDKDDNELYYGYAIGRGEVAFSGSFQKTDIAVNATTGQGSKLNIPISDARDASEVKFINFIEKDSVGKESDKSKLDIRGVQIDMNLEITPEAEVWLIFDERAGDIIKGRGYGNIQLQVFRSGDLKMYGDYEIENGEYLFTLINFVNKPFVVKKGGTIRWDGNPFGAIIDIEAEYDGLNTSVYNFILEYLNTDQAKGEARTPTDVGLTMLLSGPMLQPEINFDISFPNLTGEMKNFTDSKLRLIRQDQNELNRQVFGLLVIGGFLPNQNSGIQGTQGILGINNTVSELLTNQLSIYLTEILSDVFTDVNFISGVDFTINYNIYEADQQDVFNQNIQLYGTEIELGTKFDLFNDRFSLDVGGSYVDQGGQYFSGDLILEYYITKNRRLKARFYRLSDQTIQGRRDKTGFGLTVRREFNSFGEFIEGMRNSAKKIRDGG